VALLDQGKPIDTVTLRRNKKDTYNKNVFLSANLSNKKLRPGTNFIVTSSAPITTIDPSKFILLEDSVKVSGIEVTRIGGAERKIQVKYPWRNQRKYTLNITDGAVTDIYESKSKASVSQFTIDAADNYGNVTLKIVLPDSSAYLVEMLKENNLIRTDKIPLSGKVNFLNYPTGKYHFRIIYDQNKNGKWDTGNVKEKRQPELIWEYEKDVTLRPNWDIEEVITVPKKE
jgi:hypothetical protein